MLTRNLSDQVKVKEGVYPRSGLSVSAQVVTVPGNFLFEGDLNLETFEAAVVHVLKSYPLFLGEASKDGKSIEVDPKEKQPVMFSAETRALGASEEAIQKGDVPAINCQAVLDRYVPELPKGAKLAIRATLFTESGDVTRYMLSIKASHFGADMRTIQDFLRAVSGVYLALQSGEDLPEVTVPIMDIRGALSTYCQENACGEVVEGLQSSLGGCVHFAQSAIRGFCQAPLASTVALPYAVLDFMSARSQDLSNVLYFITDLFICKGNKVPLNVYFSDAFFAAVREECDDASEITNNDILSAVLLAMDLEARPGASSVNLTLIRQLREINKGQPYAGCLLGPVKISIEKNSLPAQDTFTELVAMLATQVRAQKKDFDASGDVLDAAKLNLKLLKASPLARLRHSIGEAQPGPFLTSWGFKEGDLFGGHLVAVMRPPRFLIDGDKTPLGYGTTGLCHSGHADQSVQIIQRAPVAAVFAGACRTADTGCKVVDAETGCELDAASLSGAGGLTSESIKKRTDIISKLLCFGLPLLLVALIVLSKMWLSGSEPDVCPVPGL